MADLAIELIGVSAGYPAAGGRRRVLDGASLRVDAGEMVALLGTNGSGKTTLLRVVAGTLRATGGEVRLLGRSIHAWSRRDIARRVAVLPQTTDLAAGMRVAELVALGRIPHGQSWFGADAGDADAVAAALRDADAIDLADRHADELSGGERQRALLAMALAQEPQVLLLDEPTLHLDLAHQLGLVRMLERLRATRPLTVLAVLHDLNLAAAFADRSVLLHDGRVVAAGEGGRIDAALAQRTFGVPLSEARAADGSRVLTLAIGNRRSTLKKNEPNADW
ncbi:MAG TPA: ABC transporter ATP-binding protein [Candidatus Limnocylindria bacterium]|nr:ABC transporter ATP-binding protein [Candidatus Limnocylindria bacterium]